MRTEPDIFDLYEPLMTDFHVNELLSKAVDKDLKFLTWPEIIDKVEYEDKKKIIQCAMHGSVDNYIDIKFKMVEKYGVHKLKVLSGIDENSKDIDPETYFNNIKGN